jgi:hypothetical protein
MGITFEKAVFYGAGIWGLLIVTPLYFLTGPIAVQHPSLLTDPQFFYSFLAVTLPWQLAFLVIGSNPARHRLLMIPAICEKFGYVTTITILWVAGRAPGGDAWTAVPDGMIGLLFVAAFSRLSRRVDSFG